MGPVTLGTVGEHQVPTRLIGFVSCVEHPVPLVGVSVKSSVPAMSVVLHEPEVGVAIEPLTVPSTSPRCGVVMRKVPVKAKPAPIASRPGAATQSPPGADAGVEHLMSEAGSRASRSLNVLVPANGTVTGRARR